LIELTLFKILKKIEQHFCTLLGGIKGQQKISGKKTLGGI
jgi:hypothetical protein